MCLTYWLISKNTTIVYLRFYKTWDVYQLSSSRFGVKPNMYMNIYHVINTKNTYPQSRRIIEIIC